MTNMTKQDIIWTFQGRVHGVRNAIRLNPTGIQAIGAYNYISGFLSALHCTGAINYNEWKSWESIIYKYIEIVAKGEQNARFDY